ncbi:MAG: ComEC family competence protein, partial [Steroidobacteraceae bacterium]|nr:ComEC family competence protein [Steroidobacteraceae bacterium]
MPIAPDWPLVAGAAVLAVAAAVRRWLLVAAVCCGVAWEGAAVARHLELRWPNSEHGTRRLVEVQLLQAADAAAARAALPARMLDPRAPWSGRRTIEIRTPVPLLAQARAGERWQLLVELYPPRAALNPGGLDMERVWFRRGVHAFGRVRPSALKRPMPRGDAAWIENWRGTIAARVRVIGRDRDADALLLALAVGHTARLSEEQWRLFQVTGITHLIAISGAHVTGLAALGFWLGARLWRSLPILHRRIACDAAAAAFGLTVAAGYAVLAGFSVPTQRTLLMLLIWRLSAQCARLIDPWQVLAWAAVGVLLLDPLAPLAAGFWLSFVAMAVLLQVGAAGGAEAPRTGSLALLWAVQWRIGIALAPLSIAIFANVSLAGFAVNLVAIPLFTLVLVPLILATTGALLLWPQVGAVMLELYSHGYGALHATLEAVASAPFAAIDVPRDSVLLAALSAAVGALLTRSARAR